MVVRWPTGTCAVDLEACQCVSVLSGDRDTWPYRVVMAGIGWFEYVGVVDGDASILPPRERERERSKRGSQRRSKGLPCAPCTVYPVPCVSYVCAGIDVPCVSCVILLSSGGEEARRRGG